MNPEFERNLWLEADPRRLAWTGVALAALYAAVGLVAHAGTLQALGYAGAVVFVVAGLVWGSRAAGRAVGDEVGERTWDFQRLSALTPWAMTWGKLFGATSLSWVAALTGLVLFVASAAATRGPGPALQEAVTGLSGAILLQAGSMALALVGVRRARAEGRNAAFRFTFGGMVGLLVVATAAGRGLRFGGPFQWLMAAAQGVSWWGVEVPQGWFVALSLAAFAAWAMVAAWRLMRLELQMENVPWAWPLFVLFAGLWAAGLAVGAAAAFAAAGAVFAACAYAAAFAEPADPVRLRRFGAAIADRVPQTALLAAPAVLAPVALAAAAVIGIALVPHEFSAPPSALQALAAFAFVLRDLGIVAYFRFGPRPGRGDFGAVVGLFLAYLVGGIVGSSLGGETGRALFTPSGVAPAVAAVSGAVQAVLVWVLAWGRVQRPAR